MKTASSKWAAALALLPLKEWFAERGVKIEDATVYSIPSVEAATDMQMELGIPLSVDASPAELPVMGFDSIAVVFEKGMLMFDESHLLVGYVYSRKAGRCAMLWYDGLKNSLEMYHAYDANRLTCDGFWSEVALGGLFLGLLRLIQECETTRVMPTFSDRYEVKRFKRMGIRAQPFLRLRKPRYRGERKLGAANAKLTHRHRRCGHERMHVQYLKSDDSQAARSLQSKGYSLYSRATLRGEIIVKLADRAKRLPDMGEVVAVRSQWIDECLVGDDALPLRSSLRVIT